MRYTNIILLAFVGFLFIPFVEGEALHSMSIIVVLISADEYKLQDIPITIHTTAFGNYCSLCNQDAACCEYCKDYSCSGEVRWTASSGGFAESAANLRFGSNFVVEGGSALCPPVFVEEGDSCTELGAVDLTKDKVWFSIDEFDYSSKQYYWDDIYDNVKFRFVIVDHFKLSEKDRESIKKGGGGALSGDEEPLEEGVISFEDIEDIISGDEAYGLNETLAENETGVVILADGLAGKEEKTLKRQPVISVELIAGLVLLIILVMFSLILILKKRKTKE